jgi:hypothetical protein
MLTGHYRSTLDQLIVIYPRFGERTGPEHTIQDFSSAERQGEFKAIPRLTVRCHRLIRPPILAHLKKIKNYPTALSKVRVLPFHLLHQILFPAD